MNSSISPNLIDKLRKIRLIIMDVDGTLTDGAMYYSAEGEAMKRFSTRDGMGLTLLHRADIQTAIMTSENSAIAAKRAQKLQVSHVVLNARNKKQELLILSQKLSVNLDEIGYIGDDVNDENPMRMCGFSATPSDGVEFIRNIADYVCTNSGGNGAVREFAELVLKAQDKPISLPEQF